MVGFILGAVTIKTTSLFYPQQPFFSFGLPCFNEDMNGQKRLEMEMGSSSLASSGACGSNDSLNGLKFGKKIYFEDVGGGSSSSSKALDSAQAKKGKGVVQGGGQQQQQPPRCQVEGCKVDLTGAKAYYCRHKVCGMHSKAPKVVVAGLEQRFCQQCSRFHQLPEFDQGKRSCRRRLAGHNERRRKPPPGLLSSRYGRMSSLFHEDSSRLRSFLLDFTYPRLPGSARDVWPTVRASDRVAAVQWPGSLVTPHGAVAVHEAHPYMQGPNSDSGLPRGQCLSGVSSDSSCALSLLSTQPWGTIACRNRAPSISAANSSFDGASMAQPVVNTCMDHLWGFKGHGANSSSHEMQHEMGFGHPGDCGHRQFSGELELALQGNRQCPDFGSGPTYDHNGHAMHWPL